MIRLTLALLFLVGCTPSTASKQAQALKEEGAKRIATANAALKDLNENFAINLNPLNETQTASERAKTYDWSKLSDDKRQAARQKLLDHNANVSRILELSRDKDVLLVGDATALKRSGEAAWEYYLSLENFAKRHVSK